MNNPEEKDARIIEDNEITLSDLVSVLLKKKLFILSLSLISTFVGISFSFFVPDTYKSTALLTPAQQSSGGISSQFSSIASFAGISLPSEGGNKTIEALERIKSYDFFSQILSKELRIEDLMAVDSWDPETNTILYDPDLYDSATNEWVRDVSYPQTVTPSLQEAYLYYRELLSISENKEDGLITLSITHESPFFARDLNATIISMINKSMRDYDKKVTVNSINFLENQIQLTKKVGVLDSLAAVQQEQIKSLTLIESNADYIFKIIDPPISPEEKDGPLRPLIALMSLLLGILLSVFYILIKHYNK